MRYRSLAACAALLFASAVQASIVFSADTSTLLTGTFSSTDNSGSYEYVAPSQFVSLLPNSNPNLAIIAEKNSLAQFGTDGFGAPNNPFETLMASGTPADLSGTYSNDSSGTRVYFLFYDQSLNLAAPAFTGDFCFSTSATTCAALATASSSVPEPASIALAGVALAGLGYSRRKKATRATSGV